jgi:ATP-dependent helicase/nuclease subunit A
MSAFANASAAQRRAADPGASVWVSANAGSGKTRVLVDRVARLLLAGARPHTILCLTFTKAAAAEMRARLGVRLGRWTAMDDAALAADLADLLGPEARIDATLRIAARRLFAATLDAPGGMRVQTIHSFCESLLRRFPIEAGVGVGFAIADETETQALLAGARDALLAAAAEDPGLGAALAEAVRQRDAAQLDEVFESLAQDRRKLRRLLAAHGGDGEAAIAALAAGLAVDPEAEPETLAAAFVAALPRAAMTRAAAALDHGSSEDRGRADALRAVLAAAHPVDALAAWLDVFLTAAGTLRKRLATKAALAADRDLADMLLAEARRCLGLHDAQARLAQFRASAAMTRLGTRLLALYDAAKRRQALLDYDDLIARAQALLADEAAAWVRFRLDGGIDHILVDEAQDTSDEQWRIVDALSEEFFAGEGARGAATRTLFAVGDEKQSIFSFQGADREAFGRARDAVAARVVEAGQEFRAVDLDYSFRSTPTVLAAVDRLFAGATARAGVAAAPTQHRAVHADRQGLFELWPLVEPPPVSTDEAWDAPLDYMSETAPRAVLARRIAATIRGWIDDGVALTPGGPAIRAGDVMVLVRRRNAFFAEMVRALKAAAVPVAGADRLVLAAHIAVQDLVALGAAALLPADDYALACLLKSPLCGLDDDDLIALCPGRAGRLWRALGARADETPRWRAAAEAVSGWIAMAERAPPFEFYARILGAGGGRARFLARLGAEAADPLDEFLALALAYERDHVPALQGFLHWFARGGAEIKRDLEQARDEVRVMTVHAAKGLEAPIVFLPDTVSVPGGRHDPKLFWPGGTEADATPPLLLWGGGEAEDTPLSAPARAASRVARLAEYRRLLYVATTRARDRLYVCGWRETARGETATADEEHWHALIAAAMRDHPDLRQVRLPWDGAMALRLSPYSEPGIAPAPSSAAVPPPLPPEPDWVRAVPPDEPRPPPPRAPSSLGAPIAASDPMAAIGTETDAARRGVALHRLFELLPDLAPAARPAAAAQCLAEALPELEATARAVLAGEALAVLDAHPALFGAGTRGEVPVLGRVGGVVLSGQIDRLVIAAETVDIVDFKSNRVPPAAAAAIPEPYVAQLAAYRALLAPLYPRHRLRCALLWTATARLDMLDAARLDAALAAALAAEG